MPRGAIKEAQGTRNRQWGVSGVKLDTEHRFSLPFAIFEEPMPDKALRLLVYLFSISNYQGICRPGYRGMKAGAEIGSNATVKACLDLLQKRGWIWTIKKGGSNNSTVALEIPSRLRKKDVPISVVRARLALKGKFPVIHSVNF